MTMQLAKWSKAKPSIRVCNHISKQSLLNTTAVNAIFTALLFVGGMINASSAFAQDSNTNSDEGSTKDEIVVTGKVYRYEEGNSGTKMDMELRDTPQSIKVITRDVIDTARMKSFEDVYKVDATGQTSNGVDSFPRNYYRGFRQQSDNSIKIDGFRLTSDVQLDLAPYERFEIVKGATSTLYGQNSIGGTLNAISYHPEHEFGMSIGVDVGSFDYYRGEIDVTGSLFSSDRLSGRLIAVYQDEGDVTLFGSGNRVLIAPSIEFEPTDNTSFMWSANYQTDDDVYSWGGPFKRISGDDTSPNFDAVEIADIPRSTWYGMPWNNAKREVFFTHLTMEHRFENDWQLRVNTQYSNIENDVKAYTTELFDADGFVEGNSIYADNLKDEVYSGEVNLFGDVEILGQEHTLFFGADYSSDKETGFSAFGFPDVPFNVFTPDYSLVADPGFARETYNRTRTLIEQAIADGTDPDDVDLSDVTDYNSTIYQVENKSVQYGATVQALIHPSEKLTVILGGRYSIVDQVDKLIDLVDVEGIINDNPTFALGTDIDENIDAFTFQIGSTYELSDSLNMYATYGQTFEPGFERAFDGDPDGDGKLVDPEKGKNYEVGLKGEIGDLAVTFSAFHTKRTNITQDDRINLDSDGDRAFVVALGTQRSKGIELEFAGELLPNLNILGSFGILSSEFTDGDFKGAPSSGTPSLGASLFADYQFENGFGANIGFVHKGGREGFDTALRVNRDLAAADPDDTGDLFIYKFDDINELDAGVYFETGSWEFELSVTNVFNQKYYSPFNNRLRFGINPNSAREFEFGARYTF